RRRSGVGLAYGALVVLAAVAMVPFLWMVATSFKHGADVYTRFPQPLPLDHRTGQWHPTLDNYRYVLGVGGLGRAFLNSVVICLMRQFFRTLPRELEEAALLDGAGRMQIFWRVVVPLSKPVLAVVTITSFIFHWNDLLWPLVVLNDKALYTLPVALQQLATQESGRAYYIMAGATLAVVPVLVVLVVFQRRILDGIAFTGLKG